MKYFGITKTGYTAGVYGCSGEYFTCIYTTDKGLKSFKFNGMYGAEERVSKMMKDRGFQDSYIQSDYGKMTRKDIMKNSYSEYTIEKNIDELLEHGYIEF